MPTTNRPRSTTTARRTYGGPAYYLGRKADVWRALPRYAGHRDRDASRIPTPILPGTGAGR